MRNKKSVLMTSKVNYGCFSGVGGIAGNVIGPNAVCVHTEINGTSDSMLSQMLKGTPCVLRFSPC